MCIYNRVYINKKYLPNKKNGYNPPTPSDLRVLGVPTKCGECIECTKAKKREWSVRLKEEIKERKNGKYTTLTFSNEEIAKLYTDKKVKGLTGYKLDNAIAKLAVWRFKERWRKEYKEYPRYWLVTELGHKNTEHLHFHGIIWTDEKIEPIWKYGGVYIGKYREYRSRGQYISNRSINYLTKYILKKDPKHLTYKSIILCNDGMGKAYVSKIQARLNKYQEGGKTREYYIDDKGVKSALPIYYRNKIYSDEEKEKLWIEKLDKKERWVLGQKIDISKNQNQYWTALKDAQEINKKRGFGNGIKNWSAEEYENQLRLTKQNERIVAGGKAKLKDYDIMQPSTEFHVELSEEDSKEREKRRAKRKIDRELAEWISIMDEANPH